MVWALGKATSWYSWVWCGCFQWFVGLMRCFAGPHLQVAARKVSSKLVCHFLSYRLEVKHKISLLLSVYTCTHRPSKILYCVAFACKHKKWQYDMMVAEQNLITLIFAFSCDCEQWIRAWNFTLEFQTVAQKMAFNFRGYFLMHTVGQCHFSSLVNLWMIIVCHSLTKN